MKNIFKGKTKRAAIISSAAAICLVLAGATVYAINVTGQNAAVSADTSISKAVSEGAQSYESQMSASTASSGADAGTQAAASTVYGNGGQHHYAEHHYEGYGYGNHHGQQGVACGNGPGATAGIGLEKAKSIALGQVSGATASDITVAHCDYDDGHLEYDIEIGYNGNEYEFEIDGTSGTILSHDIDHHDHWD